MKNKDLDIHIQRYLDGDSYEFDYIYEETKKYVYLSIYTYIKNQMIHLTKKGKIIILSFLFVYYTLKQLPPINSLIKELHGIADSSISLKYFKYLISLFAVI